MKNTRIFQGFSLAEALITLLIVCLITLASIPVLTKKKRTQDMSGHGKWMCTINNAGQHVYWSKEASNGDPNNPETWTVSGTGCKFVAPKTARNFAITASAGGGGGAGASMEDKRWINSDASITAPGMYYMLAIGGGGGGGGSSDRDDTARCGGMGGVGAASVYLDDSVTQLRVSRGYGGSHGTGSNDGHAGDASGSSITVYKRNSTTGNTDACTLIDAPGGMGGYNGEHGSDHAEWGGEAGSAKYNYCGLYSGVDYRTYNANREQEPMRGKFLHDDVGWYAAITGIGHPTKSIQTSVNSVLRIVKFYPELEMDGSDTYNRNVSYYSLNSTQRTNRNAFCAIPGLGGAAKEGEDACSSHGGNDGSEGKNGYVGIYTKLYKSGGGGKAGEIVKNVFYPNFDKPVEVTVGAGGIGGNKGSGGSGGTTIIRNIAIQPLVGGSGGYIKTSGLMAYTRTPGDDGEKTKLYYAQDPVIGYGGYSGYNSGSPNGATGTGFGAGGGGGGIAPEVETNPGIGAQGSPGIVIIEW